MYKSLWKKSVPMENYDGKKSVDIWQGASMKYYWIVSGA